MVRLISDEFKQHIQFKQEIGLRVSYAGDV